MRRSARLLVTALAAFACSVLVLAAPQPFRAIGGLLLVLVVPGLAVVTAVTRRRPWAAEYGVLVVGASLATCILGGLLLDRLPDGLTTESWALALAYGAVAVVIVAALRPGRSRPLRLRPRRIARPTTRQLVLLGVAGVTAAVAVGIAKASEEESTRKTPVLQLWMLQSRSGSSTTLRIGVDTHHVPTAVYRLEVRTSGGTPTIWQVPVKGDTQWRAIVEVPRGKQQPVDALLYSADRPSTVLRRTRQWVR